VEIKCLSRRSLVLNFVASISEDAGWNVSEIINTDNIANHGVVADQWLIVILHLTSMSVKRVKI
jgi:hypothetical protein